MKGIYGWVPWFAELAGVIADNGPEFLVERAVRVRWRETGEDPPLLQQFRAGDVDPFSFVYTLAGTNRRSDRERVFASVADEFGLANELPVETGNESIFPTPYVNQLFRHGSPDDATLLWRLFRSVVEGLDAVAGDDFENAQRINGVAATKLTQALCLVNGREFVPYDRTLLALLPDDAGRRQHEVSWDEYRDTVAALLAAFPGCRPCEINLLGYETGGMTPLTVNPQGLWQISSRAGGDDDAWDDFERNGCAYATGLDPAAWDEGDPQAREPVLDLGDAGRGDILLARNGRTGHGIGVVRHNDYAERPSSDARLHVVWLCKHEEALEGELADVAFSKAHRLGDAFRRAYPEAFAFLDRVEAPVRYRGDEDRAARRQRDPVRSGPLNTILYGPPGTGKTYRTVERCVAICDGHVPTAQGQVRRRYDRLVAEGRVKFVTFHQSYGYEEFVEGIRPAEVDGGVVYRVEPGILKELAAAASGALAGGAHGAASGPPFDTLWRRLRMRAQDGLVVRTKRSGTEYVLAVEDDGVYLTLADGGRRRRGPYRKEDYGRLWHSGYREDPTMATSRRVREKVGRRRHGSYDWIVYRELWELAQAEEEFDLATGDAALRYIHGTASEPRYAMLQGGDGWEVAPGGLYDRIFDVLREAGEPVDCATVLDALRRMRPRDGVSESDVGSMLLRMVRRKWIHVAVPRRGEGPAVDAGEAVAPSGGVPNFVLVIDEINRANISKVMGELITLLEEDKREGAANEVTVTLPYSREPFALPPNLHVLGTMNTADRSIALLDTALRRRFDFEEVAPDPGQLHDAKQRTGVDLPAVLEAMNERLEYLVDRDRLIGHAWLMGARDRSHLDDLMRRRIIPLIAEYFYDDWTKVRAVLGGTDAFVERVELRVPPGTEPDVSPRYRWTIRREFAAGAYEDIVSGTGGQPPADDQA